MTLGVGLFLVAVGAILTFAVNATVSGVDLNTVGIILMIVGAVGVLLDLVLFMPRRRRATREVYTSNGPVDGMPNNSAPASTVTRERVDGTY
jgi:hypothetical protein